MNSDDGQTSLAEDILDHKFSDRSLLRTALTHPSYLDEVVEGESYERLEFLGDAVISLVIAEQAYRTHPELPEGDLTRLKIAAVSGSMLTAVAEELGLADALFLGSSERAAGERGRASALENAFEALVGALYLDGGFEAARTFVGRVLGPVVADAKTLLEAHPKSALQELVQASGRQVIYHIIDTEGPPHARMFTASVEVDGVALGEGRGSSKREAQMRAAEEALLRLSSSSVDTSKGRRGTGP